MNDEEELAPHYNNFDVLLSRVMYNWRRESVMTVLFFRNEEDASNAKTQLQEEYEVVFGQSIPATAFLLKDFQNLLSKRSENLGPPVDPKQVLTSPPPSPPLGISFIFIS